MKYLITYQFNQDSMQDAKLDSRDTSPVTELVDAEDFEDWWTDNEGTIYITLFQKIGNEVFEYELRMGYPG